MKIRNKEQFIKKLFIFRHIRFIKYETDIKDYELELIISALNIKNRYKRIGYIINEGCDYIDNYYKKCRLCYFKDNKCICHRKLDKDYINGCCRRCIYQSNKGCITKNVACKLFNCTYVEYNGLKRLEFKDIRLFKVLNLYQRYILKNDYFSKIEDTTKDLYVGPIFLIIRFIKKFLVTRVIR